uniref:UBC core domain-containing protein n=1 Tax=Rhizophora mucronata TaxID=61149 RepID=A0A2P2L215_RHIMU
MSFPSNYPNSPPTVKFTSEIWHPNGWFILSTVF